MNQPTLTSIPGILFRTTVRLVARLILILAGALMLAGAALALVSLLLATWRTPRSRRISLAIDIALLATELAKERRRVTKTDSL